MPTQRPPLSATPLKLSFTSSTALSILWGVHKESSATGLVTLSRAECDETRIYYAIAQARRFSTAYSEFKGYKDIYVNGLFCSQEWLNVLEELPSFTRDPERVGNLYGMILVPKVSLGLSVIAKHLYFVYSDNGLDADVMALTETVNLRRRLMLPWDARESYQHALIQLVDLPYE